MRARPAEAPAELRPSLAEAMAKDGGAGHGRAVWIQVCRRLQAVTKFRFEVRGLFPNEARSSAKCLRGLTTLIPEVSAEAMQLSP